MELSAPPAGNPRAFSFFPAPILFLVSDGLGA
jgi:hypothetical protein